MRNPIIALAGRRGRAQHPGLLLQRFLSKVATGDDGDPAERRALLDAACAAAGDRQVQELYGQAFHRQREAAARAVGACYADLTTVGRMVIGLGCENVLETGLRLHHTYGLPIIPGSALKGLASHYCHHAWGQSLLAEHVPEENLPFRRGGPFHELLFGKVDDAGVIAFHDAWITPDSVPECLCLDVMTPHHPRWQTNEAPPTDFDSPVPVSFLSVQGTFRVGVSWAGPRETDADTAAAWTRLAFKILQEALAEWGIGGKTTSGYGRLVAAGAQHNASLPRSRAVAPSVTHGGTESEQVTVSVLERRQSGGKVQFLVQEEGLPRGVLAYGNPPPEELLPKVGDSIVVYRNNRDRRAPQYRWDKPGSAPQKSARGGPGGRPPRGQK